MPRSRICASHPQMPEWNQKRERKREALCYVILWLLSYDSFGAWHSFGCCRYVAWRGAKVPKLPTLVAPAVTAQASKGLTAEQQQGDQNCLVLMKAQGLRA